MRWSDELYIGDGIAERASVLIDKMNSGDFTENAWLLTLPANKSNQLDIIHTVFLKETWIRKSLPLIIGIANSKTEAMRLTARILSDSLRTHCGADMRMYLAEKHFTVSEDK